MYVFEAIRLGSMLRPQEFCERHSKQGTCVLGAIEDAVGNCEYAAEKVFPILTRPVVHPVTGNREHLGAILAGLNNRGADYIHGEYDKRHAWTRERIADWLEPIELAWHAQHTPEPQPQQETPEPVLV
jgi:hypothetical protein